MIWVVELNLGFSINYEINDDMIVFEGYDDHDFGYVSGTDNLFHCVQISFKSYTQNNCSKTQEWEISLFSWFPLF